MLFKHKLLLLSGTIGEEEKDGGGGGREERTEEREIKGIDDRNFQFFSYWIPLDNIVIFCWLV